MSTRCPECKTPAGSQHEPECFAEHCAICGFQYVTCKCIKDHDYFREVEELGGPIPWVGEWHGYAEAREYDFWCRWALTMNGHDPQKPCEPTEHGARPDLTRLGREGRWDKLARRWVLRDPASKAAEDARQREEKIAELRARIAELEGKP